MSAVMRKVVQIASNYTTEDSILHNFSCRFGFHVLCKTSKYFISLAKIFTIVSIMQQNQINIGWLDHAHGF